MFNEIGPMFMVAIVFLAVLAVGLVVDRPAGNRRIYHVNPDGLDALRAQLDRFWGKALTTYKEVVEQPTDETR